METATITKTAVFTQMEKFILQGGPEQEDFASVDAIVNCISDLTREERISQGEIEAIKQQCGFISDSASIMGHIKNKPYGYAGDFEIIDRIYQHGIKKEEYAKWDGYALNNAAAQAVRNRKTYFKALMSTKLDQAQAPIKMLDVASGPARDLYEMFSKMSDVSQVDCTCVELDKQAIKFAKELNKAYLSQIEFQNANVFRYKTDEKFDLIWSAGLFDYFNDKAFKLVLSRFKEWLAPGGEIVIGNFNENHNPSRAYMEIWGEWYLQHRTSEDLIRLAVETGFDRSQIYVGHESENINLFLHIKG